MSQKARHTTRSACFYLSQAAILVVVVVSGAPAFAA